MLKTVFLFICLLATSTALQLSPSSLRVAQKARWTSLPPRRALVLRKLAEDEEQAEVELKQEIEQEEADAMKEVAATWVDPNASSGE